MRDALTVSNAQDLLEVCDDRFGRSSTVIASQIPVAEWHARLPGSVLVEIAGDWQVGRRYFSLDSMARVIAPEPLLVAEPVQFHLAPVH